MFYDSIWMHIQQLYANETGGAILNIPQNEEDDNVSKYIQAIQTRIRKDYWKEAEDIRIIQNMENYKERSNKVLDLLKVSTNRIFQNKWKSIESTKSAKLLEPSKQELDKEAKVLLSDIDELNKKEANQLRFQSNKPTKAASENQTKQQTPLNSLASPVVNKRPQRTRLFTSMSQDKITVESPNQNSFPLTLQPEAIITSKKFSDDSPNENRRQTSESHKLKILSSLINEGIAVLKKTNVASSVSRYQDSSGTTKASFFGSKPNTAQRSSTSEDKMTMHSTFTSMKGGLSMQGTAKEFFSAKIQSPSSVQAGVNLRQSFISESRTKRRTKLDPIVNVTSYSSQSSTPAHRTKTHPFSMTNFKSKTATSFTYEPFGYRKSINELQSKIDAIEIETAQLREETRDEIKNIDQNINELGKFYEEKNKEYLIRCEKMPTSLMPYSPEKNIFFKKRRDFANRLSKKLLSAILD